MVEDNPFSKEALAVSLWNSIQLEKNFRALLLFIKTELEFNNLNTIERELIISILDSLE